MKRIIKILSFDEIMTEAARVEAASPEKANDVIMYYCDSRCREWLFAMHAKSETVSFIHHALRAYRWRVERPQLLCLQSDEFLREESNYIHYRTEELNILEDMLNVFRPVSKTFASINRAKLWMP